MKMEIALLAGAESKAFLASLTQQIDRLEKLTASIGGSKAVPTKTAAAAKAVADFDDEEDDTPFAKTGKATKVSSFEDDEEIDAAAEEDEEEDFSTPVKKTKKTKEPAATRKDVTIACNARSKAHGFKSTKALLLKKFKVESIDDLDVEQYPAVIAAMAV